MNMKLLAPALLLASATLGACTSVRNKIQGRSYGEGLTAAKMDFAAAVKPPITTPFKRVSPADKDRIADCVENTALPMQLKFSSQRINFFAPSGESGLSFYLTEENNWPFMVGLYKVGQYQIGNDYFIGLRGEASGWHKSAANEAVLSLTDALPGSALILLDEYSYLPKKGKSTLPSLMPICHRSYHKSGYLGTETPGFQKGGATKLLRRALALAENSAEKTGKMRSEMPTPPEVVFVSYSNATSPRGEFIPREPRPGYNPDYKKFGDPAKFLRDHILETRFVDGVYGNIRGFIDIEGNFEYTKSFWDLLAYIKVEIETRPETKFFYSIARVEKFDAYPGQLTMINALGLTGVEGSDGIIRFRNKKGNVIIDIVTNPYQPYYWNVGKDIRTATKMQPYKGNDIKRQRLSHFNLPAFAIPHVLHTTPFLRRRSDMHVSFLR